MQFRASAFWNGGEVANAIFINVQLFMAYMGNEYVVIKFQGKLTYEHRVVMENFIKRKLKKNEVVHHINGNKKDNRIENLIIMKLKKHNCFEANKKELLHSIIN